MRRRHRRRSTWFPILGFDTIGTQAAGLSTVDVRDITVAPTGAPNITIIPIIPDIDVPPEESQQAGGEIRTTLRDFVEGQSCIIDRITGVCVWEAGFAGEAGALSSIIACTAIAVVPTADDGSGNPAISANELDPLRADNSAQPWFWRRVWVLGNAGAQTSVGAPTQLPGNNTYGSAVDGPKIDTNGVKRAIRREERIFLIHSVLASFPDAEAIQIQARAFVDLRVVGHMTKAHNRSSFK